MDFLMAGFLIIATVDHAFIMCAEIAIWKPVGMDNNSGAQLGDENTVSTFNTKCIKKELYGRINKFYFISILIVMIQQGWQCFLFLHQRDNKKFDFQTLYGVFTCSILHFTLYKK